MTRPGTAVLNCPCCGRTFETDILYSTNSFGGTTTDLRPIAVGEQPTRYGVHSCPDCGYAGGEDDFDEPLPPHVVALVTERIAPLISEQRPSIAKQFEFAAWIAEWLGQAPERIGDNYLQAAWIQDELSSEPQEGERSAADYRRLAVDWFVKAVDPQMPVTNHSLTLVYLIGELHRRSGDPAAAEAWFTRVITEAADNPDLARLAALARRQRDDPQEFLPRTSSA
jgi:hypothetical protein